MLRDAHKRCLPTVRCNHPSPTPDSSTTPQPTRQMTGDRAEQPRAAESIPATATDKQRRQNSQRGWRPSHRALVLGLLQGGHLAVERVPHVRHRLRDVALQLPHLLLPGAQLRLELRCLRLHTFANTGSGVWSRLYTVLQRPYPLLPGTELQFDPKRACALVKVESLNH
jgi:hypothetical protein